MTQNQRSYYAFLRAVKARFDVTHQQAMSAYRVYKTQQGVQPRAIDVDRHPRLTKRAVEAGSRRLALMEKKRERERRANLERAERERREREAKVDEKRLSRLIENYEGRKKIINGKIYVQIGSGSGAYYILAVDYEDDEGFAYSDFEDYYEE